MNRPSLADRCCRAALSVLISAVALSCTVHAASQRQWDKQEQQIIGWFNRELSAKLKAHPRGYLTYTAKIVTQRWPYLLGHGKSSGAAHPDVPAQYGFGNCADLAYYIKRRYEEDFRRGPKTLPARPMVIIRGSSPSLLYGTWAHGSDVIIPTDRRGRPVLLPGNRLPRMTDVFTSRATASGFFNHEGLRRGDQSSGLYKSRVAEAHAKIQAWQNALVLDAWRRKYMTFGEWQARPVMRDFWQAAKSGRLSPQAKARFDKYQSVEIGVERLQNWGGNPFLDVGAYNSGCRAGRRVRYLKRKWPGKWQEKVRQHLDVARRKWGFSSADAAKVATAVSQGRADRNRMSWSERRQTMAAFERGLKDGENKGISTIALDKDKFDMLDKMEAGFESIPLPKTVNAQTGQNVALASLFEQAYQAQVPGRSNAFKRSPVAYRKAFEHNLKVAGAKNPKLNLAYYWKLTPGFRMNLVQHMPVAVRGRTKPGPFSLSGYDESGEMGEHVLKFSRSGPYQLVASIILHADGPIFGDWGEIIAMRNHNCTISVGSTGQSTAVAIKSFGAFPMKTIGTHRMIGKQTKLGVTLNRAPRQGTAATIALSASPSGHIQFTKTQITIPHPQVQGEVYITARKPNPKVQGTQKVTITATLVGSDQRASTTVDVAHGSTGPAVDWKKRMPY